MKVEFEIEEGRELFLFLCDRILAEAGLDEKDRATLRKWRGDEMRPGSPAMRDLHARVNADLARAMATKKRSAAAKPDWR
jgi:hypothetical protein